MTQPADGTTATTTTDTTATTDTAAATDTGTTTGTATDTAAATATDTGSPWNDPAKAQAEIERLRRENAAARTTAKQQAADEARTQLLKDLGLVKDDQAQPDPAKLSQDIADRDRLLAVYQHAPKDVDVTALMDRVSFRDKIKSIDPADNAALAAAIGDAVTADPRLKATPGAAPVGGAQQVAGGSAAARVYSREQLRNPEFFAANRADILRAQAEGRIRE